MNRIKPHRSNYPFNESSAGSWLSVSTSLGEGGIGSTMDESEDDWALFESGGTSNGVYPLVFHVNLEGWLARDPGGSWESVSPSSPGGDAFS